MKLPTPPRRTRAYTVSVREKDLPIWDRAVRYCATKRMPMSPFIITLLEKYLGDVETPSEKKKRTA